MREIDLVYRTMYAELAQRSLDAQFVRDFAIKGVEGTFPVEGSFVTTTVKGRQYGYSDFLVESAFRRCFPSDFLDLASSASR